MSADETLERRYRRLLRCYPPSHREAHREEMLGVLLDAARPGQCTPGLTQTVNLAACGLAIRARRALVPGPWQDALAVVSLIAPVLMLVSSVLYAGDTVREAVMANRSDVPGTPFWTMNLVPTLVGPALLIAAWLTVMVLGLAGRRLAAAAVACVPLALDLLVVLVLIMQRTGAVSTGIYGFLYGASLAPILASLATCSLAFSAGPRRGLAIVGRRRACLVVAILAIGTGLPWLFDLLSPVVILGQAYTFVSALVIAIPLAVRPVRRIAGGRVTALLATAFVLDLDPFAGTMISDLALLSATLLLTLLVWPIAVASWTKSPQPADG